MNWKRSEKSRTTKRTLLGLETLESRVTPAGNVFVALLGDDLLILGDRQDNQVEVVGTEDGGVEVVGLEGTTINGTAAGFAASAMPDDLLAILGRGNDQLRIRGVDIADDATILGQAGDDEVALLGTTVGDDLRILTHGGDDEVLAEAVTVGDRTSLLTHAGDDVVTLRDGVFGGGLSVHAGSGDDAVFIDPTVVNGRTTLRMGGGDDGILLVGANEFNGKTTLDGGSGEDRVLRDQANLFADNPRIRGVEEVVERDLSGSLAGTTFDALPPGQGTVDLDGGTLTGGVTATFGHRPFYATAPRGYFIGDSGTATLTFDTPVEATRFFFIHGSGTDFLGNPVNISPAIATAYDADGNVVATATSNTATFLGDTANFVTLAGSTTIATIVIEGGLIDNVEFIR